MNAAEAAMVAALVLAAIAAAWILYRSHKTPARNAVKAICLVCAYTEAHEDVRTATAAGNAHGEATGHPLILGWP